MKNIFIFLMFGLSDKLIQQMLLLLPAPVVTQCKDAEQTQFAVPTKEIKKEKWHTPCIMYVYIIILYINELRILDMRILEIQKD